MIIYPRQKLILDLKFHRQPQHLLEITGVFVIADSNIARGPAPSILDETMYRSNMLYSSFNCFKSVLSKLIKRNILYI